ncbi:MAG TPA: hypothetical protein VL382_03885, partial [Terriglobales bacterium]|nr:hypothetical protein [Terriglobales bacterium]
TRRPYLGFGVDAHSMLPAATGAVRFASPDNLDDYMRGVAPTVTPVTREQQVEEAFFLGLRLEQGVDLAALRAEFGEAALAPFLGVADELVHDAMLARDGTRLRLTDRGRLISNEVFERFLGLPAASADARQRRAIV